MKFELPVHIQSLAQLQAVQLELSDAAATVRRRAAKAKIGLAQDRPNSQASPELKALLAAWRQNGHPGSLTELRQQLDDLAKHPVVISLILPAVASIDFRTKLVAWLRTEIRPNLLVNFMVSSEIGGGLIIRTPSRVYDYSFRNLLIRAGSKIPEIVRRV